MRLAFTVALLLTTPGRRAAAQTVQPPEMHIELSKSSVLLGEPVWVDVAVTNRSWQSVLIKWGSDCFDEQPIQIVVPAATQGNGEPKHCGGMSGDCMVPWPSPLLPGVTARQRYVLAGDFRITAAGLYNVSVLEKIGWQVAPTDPKEHNPSRGWVDLSQSTSLPLDVKRPNAAKLLTLEQQLATHADELLPRFQPPVPASSDSESNMKALRAASADYRVAEQEHERQRRALYAGIEAFPVAGMEPIFEAWETEPHGNGNGVLALYHLNTPVARAALARLTAPSPATAKNRSSDNAIRFGAAYSLGRMGDRSYVPLLEKLSSDDSGDVRVLSILALGRLGGESELPFLEHIASSAPHEGSRRTAIQAMAYTRSRKAVPFMIVHITSPQPSPDDSYWLMSMTHHQLPPVDPQRTPQALQAAWSDWWSAHHTTAEMFTPDDCTEHLDR